MKSGDTLSNRVVAQTGIPFFYGRGYRYFPESNTGRHIFPLIIAKKAEKFLSFRF